MTDGNKTEQDKILLEKIDKLIESNRIAFKDIKDKLKGEGQDRNEKEFVEKIENLLEYNKKTFGDIEKGFDLLRKI